MAESNRTASIAQQFESSRPRLRVLAYRMLGTLADADDAVQESWLRVSRSDTSIVENFDGWVTTLTSRVCIDMLRRRASRRENLAGLAVDGPPRSPARVDPESEAMLVDAIGSALMIVLENLSPAERVSYVLHDMFDVPFEEIATVVGRSEAAVRQLASRGRRRARGATPGPAPDAVREREVVRAFLAASREGDFEALLELLSPDVVFRADAAGVRLGATREARGSTSIIEGILKNPGPALRALVDGRPAVVRLAGDAPVAAVTFTIEKGKITGIELVGDPEAVGRLDIVLLPD